MDSNKVNKFGSRNNSDKLDFIHATLSDHTIKRFVFEFSVNLDKNVLSGSSFNEKQSLHVAGEKVLIKFDLECDIIERELHLITTVTKGKENPITDIIIPGENANLCRITLRAPDWSTAESCLFPFPARLEYTATFTEVRENEPLKILAEYAFSFAE